MMLEKSNWSKIEYVQDYGEWYNKRLAALGIA